MSFPTTHWSVLAKATMNGDAAGRDALGALCRNYWRPVKEFLQQRGWKDEDAEDLTQEFFSALLLSKGWHRADQARGKFRNFLLGALMRVLRRNQEHNMAQKRGGGQMTLSLDALAEEGFEPSEASPRASHQFDLAWAEQVLESALEAVAANWEMQGKSAEFQVLLPHLPAGAPTRSYEEAALDLSMSLGAVKTQISRLRQQLRDQFEIQISRTVSAPHEIDEEMAHLHAVMADPRFYTSLPNDETSDPLSTEKRP